MNDLPPGGNPVPDPLRRFRLGNVQSTAALYEILLLDVASRLGLMTMQIAEAGDEVTKDRRLAQQEILQTVYRWMLDTRGKIADQYLDDLRFAQRLVLEDTARHIASALGGMDETSWAAGGVRRGTEHFAAMVDAGVVGPLSAAALDRRPQEGQEHDGNE